MTESRTAVQRASAFVVIHRLIPLKAWIPDDVRHCPRATHLLTLKYIPLNTVSIPSCWRWLKPFVATSFPGLRSYLPREIYREMNPRAPHCVICHENISNRQLISPSITFNIRACFLDAAGHSWQHIMFLPRSASQRINLTHSGVIGVRKVRRVRQRLSWLGR